MYFHLAAYATTTAGAETNTDLPAPADGVFQRQNNHIIFTDPTVLIGAMHVGATVARARFANASLITHGIPHIWPVNVSATIPDRPWVSDFRDAPWELPQDEEITIEHTNGAADQVTTLLYLADQRIRYSLPAHLRALTVRATVVIAAGAENTWGTPVAVVFERALIQGTYAVVGCRVVAANAIAFRVRFPSQGEVNGKQYRPGGPVQNTATTLPSDYWERKKTEWGRFHTFEPPEIQVLSDAAGGTYEVRMDLLYLGRSRELVRGG